MKSKMSYVVFTAAQSVNIITYIYQTLYIFFLQQRGIFNSQFLIIANSKASNSLTYNTHHTNSPLNS